MLGPKNRRYGRTGKEVRPYVLSPAARIDALNTTNRRFEVEKLLSYTECAERLDVPKWAVMKWLDDGHLTRAPYTVAGNETLFAESDVDQFGSSVTFRVLKSKIVEGQALRP